MSGRATLGRLGGVEAYYYNSFFCGGEKQITHSRPEADPINSFEVPVRMPWHEEKPKTSCG